MSPQSADLTALKTNNDKLAKQYPQKVSLNDFNLLAEYALRLENELELAQREIQIQKETIAEYEELAEVI